MTLGNLISYKKLSPASKYDFTTAAFVGVLALSINFGLNKTEISNLEEKYTNMKKENV